MADPAMITCSICLNAEPAAELEAFPIPHSAISNEFVTRICARCVGAIAAHLVQLGDTSSSSPAIAPEAEPAIAPAASETATPKGDSDGGDLHVAAERGASLADSGRGRDGGATASDSVDLHDSPANSRARKHRKES